MFETCVRRPSHPRASRKQVTPEPAAGLVSGELMQAVGGRAIRRRFLAPRPAPRALRPSPSSTRRYGRRIGCNS